MRYLIALLLMLLPTVALAANSEFAYDCNFSADGLTGTISPATPGSGISAAQGTSVVTATLNGNSSACIRFNSSITANSFLTTPVPGGSAILAVKFTASSNVIQFDPQIDAADITAATATLITVFRCPQGKIIEAGNPERSCQDLGGENGTTSLSGVEGQALTQNYYKRVGPGLYVVRVIGACLASDTCTVQFQSEGDPPR